MPTFLTKTCSPPPPKRVDFLDAYVLELRDRPDKPICAVEKLIEGQYKKYNNNGSWSDDLRSTPQVCV